MRDLAGLALVALLAFLAAWLIVSIPP